MKFEFDLVAAAAYFEIWAAEIAHVIIADHDAEGYIVGIDVLPGSKRGLPVASNQTT